MTDADQRTHAELAASTRELVGAISRQIDFYVEQMGLSKSEANQRARDLGLSDPVARRPDQLTWSDLTCLLEKDPAAAQALWTRAKETAQQELATGTRTARSLEWRIEGRPYERLQFLAIVEGLRRSLAPRNDLEELLIQQMASAYELQLRWQTLAVHRMEEESWQAERDRRRVWENLSPQDQERSALEHGWLPPRESDAEAIAQATLTAERYQRAFLRLLKAFRDTRRLVGTVVLAGGQLNVAEQQINVAAAPNEGERRDG